MAQQKNHSLPLFLSLIPFLESRPTFSIEKSIVLYFSFFFFFIMNTLEICMHLWNIFEFGKNTENAYNM